MNLRAKAGTGAEAAHVEGLFAEEQEKNLFAKRKKKKARSECGARKKEANEQVRDREIKTILLGSFDDDAQMLSYSWVKGKYS